MTIANAMRTTFPAYPPLLSDVVHVWQVNLDQPDSVLQHLAQTLAVDERAKAERFHFVRDRNRFVVCRAILREILARYLDIESAQIEFCYGRHGKPVLAAAFQDRELRFNVSHSYEIALFAFTRQREIGVDIERIRPLSDVEQIVERYFSYRERTMFRSLPTAQRLPTFFTWWTCKEAYLKALGEGLAYPLDQVDVSMVTEKSASLVRIVGDQPAIGWSVRSFSTVPGYAAAFAVEGDTGGFAYQSVLEWEVLPAPWSTASASTVRARAAMGAGRPQCATCSPR